MTPNTPSSGMIINWLILITLGVIWGASFLGVELALTGFGPITLAAGRVVQMGAQAGRGGPVTMEGGVVVVSESPLAAV